MSNYTTTDNIKGDEKRHRVGKVVAQAHQRIANYAHKNRVYEKYAIDTQQGTFPLFILSWYRADGVAQITLRLARSWSTARGRLSGMGWACLLVCL